MERDSDSVAAPEHAAPGEAGPEQAAPQQAVSGEAAPEQAAPEQARTGHAGVDEALARLGDLGGLPVEEHPAVFEYVHRGLTAALGTLDSGAEDTSGIPGTHGTSVTSIPSGS